GKTRQAIIAAGDTSEDTVLVVCPASLKINWEREIKMVYPEDEVLVISGGLSAFGDEGAEAYQRSAWVVINYDILDRHKDWLLEEAKKGAIGTVIFDEAHYIKDARAIRTKAALAIALHAKQAYLLTGTPVMNRPIELFSLLRAVKHPLAYNEEKAMSVLRREYGKRYCGAYFHRLGYTGRGFWDESGATRLPELREMTKEVFLRRTKAEVLDLPPKIISVVPVELGPEWREKYDTAWDQYLQWAADHPDEVNVANALSAQAMIELGKLKQVCSQAKLDRIVADVQNAIEQGEKVIVFSQYTETIRELQKKFNDHKPVITSVRLTGEDDQTARQRAVDSFQRPDGPDVFIANIKAGGVGLTLTA
ncbi:MAG: DEAD/DEAH box helicase, partial [Cyanobacteria bacterium REEB65]|nr:DEAD/DEAH box helicase [Cyanobacteria bacterium REEB65]